MCTGNTSPVGGSDDSIFIPEEPLYGGAVLRYLESSMPVGDPAIADSLGEREAASQGYSRLVKIDSGGRMVGELAESWIWSEDSLSLTIALRDHMRSAYGDVLTAEIVAASIQRLLRINKDSPAAGVLRDIMGAPEFLSGEAEKISGLKVLDETVLVIVLSEPQPLLLSALADVNCAPLLPRGEGRSTHAGWGAFLKESPGRFVPNLRFFRGRPYLDNLIFGSEPVKPSSDWRRRVIAPVGSRPVEENNPAVVFPGRRCVYLAVNPASGALSSASARRAVLASVDREALVKVFIGGSAESLLSLLPGSVAPAALFSEASSEGERKASGLGLTLGYPAGNAELESVAGRLQADLLLAGFRCAVNPYSGKGDAETDLLLVDVLVAADDASYCVWGLLSRLSVLTGGYFQADRPRGDLFAWLGRLHQSLVLEGYLIPLYHSAYQVFAGRNLRDLRFRTDGTLDFEGAWIASAVDQKP